MISSPCGFPSAGRQGSRLISRPAVPPSSSSTMPFCSTCWRASRPITTPCLAAPTPCPRSREHRLASVSYFALCRPMMEMIELQVWLAQGQAVKVLARCEELLGRLSAVPLWAGGPLCPGADGGSVRTVWPACRGPGCSGAGAGRGRAGRLLDAAGRKLPLSGPAAGAGRAGAVPSRWWSGPSLWGSGTRPGAPSSTGSADRPAIAAALTEKELALARAGGPAPHQQGDRRNTPPLGGNG